MGTADTRVEGGDEVVVRRCTGQDMAKKKWLVLLLLTTLDVIANISCDGLTGGRYAVPNTRCECSVRFEGKEHALLAHETELHGHLCKVLDGHSHIVLWHP